MKGIHWAIGNRWKQGLVVDVSTQQIGDAAHGHGFQAIRSPSATGVDRVLVIFPENLAGAVLDVRLLSQGSTTDELTDL